jgi:hypothetical protein
VRYVLSFERKSNKIELGYNDVGLYVISYIASDVLWYKFLTVNHSIVLFGLTLVYNWTKKGWLFLDVTADLDWIYIVWSVGLWAGYEIKIRVFCDVRWRSLLHAKVPSLRRNLSSPSSGHKRKVTWISIIVRISDFLKEHRRSSLWGAEQNIMCSWLQSDNTRSFSHCCDRFTRFSMDETTDRTCEFFLSHVT